MSWAQMERPGRSSVPLPWLSQALLDALPWRVVVLDGQGLIVAVNVAWQAFMVQAPNGRLGHNYFDLGSVAWGSDPDVAAHAAVGIRSLVEASSDSFQTEIGWKERWFEVRAALLPGGHVLVTHHDVTERREAQASLQALQQAFNDRLDQRIAELLQDHRALHLANITLERASRAKDEFLAGMSHELRTPLNAILGFSEVLLEDVHGALNERQRLTVGRIQEGGRLLLALINDILDLSKIEAGKVTLNHEKISVAELCRASLRLVQETALRKQITLSLQLDENFTMLVGDERRIKQVLVNLLSNAVKFTPTGGRVGIDASLRSSHALAEFVVWDTGIGIGADDQTRLFQPFVQINTSLSRDHAGTGLGLALVRRLVELHNGTVHIESEQNKGSRFVITIPMQWERPSLHTTSVPPARRSERTVTRPSNGSNPQHRILLAEDDEATVVTILDILRSRGYDVVVARDGSEVVSMARALRPALVLMDIQMPVLDGLAAIQEIRADACPEVSRVPILALTALAMPGDRERCLHAGANEYLSKPISLRFLVSTIETILAAHSPHGSPANML